MSINRYSGGGWWGGGGGVNCPNKGIFKNKSFNIIAYYLKLEY